jgi:hypothetical protein
MRSNADPGTARPPGAPRKGIGVKLKSDEAPGTKGQDFRRTSPLRKGEVCPPPHPEQMVRMGDNSLLTKSPSIDSV